MTDARIVFTTVDDLQKAQELARQLVDLRLAACVNIVERVHSVYRWKDEVETADEVLLIVKTVSANLPILKEKLSQLHPYELPELLVTDVTDGSDAYLAWLLAESRGDAG